QRSLGDLQRTLQILQQIGINKISDSDCLHVAYVCEVVSTRAAHLTAAGVSCILSRMQKKFVTVGIDGSVYRFHPKFDKILDSKINDLLPKNLDYQLMLSEDGSGRGAALVAAVADRIRKERGHWFICPKLQEVLRCCASQKFEHCTLCQPNIKQSDLGTSHEIRRVERFANQKNAGDVRAPPERKEAQNPPRVPEKGGTPRPKGKDGTKSFGQLF
ncbi:unnamed protein product, partial [Litomosoides sigmodontis]